MLFSFQCTAEQSAKGWTGLPTSERGLSISVVGVGYKRWYTIACIQYQMTDRQQLIFQLLRQSYVFVTNFLSHQMACSFTRKNTRIS
jgi:hypothetical protein